MAVEAQYLSNIYAFNRRGAAAAQQPQDLQLSNPTPILIIDSNSNAAAANGRKRPREAPPPAFISLAQLQKSHQHPPPFVSTGLRLASDDQSILAGDLADMDRFLAAQGEALRLALAERRRRHQLALIAAAEELTVRRLREKEAELAAAARRSVELEERVARLRAEAVAWQAQAAAGQAAAAGLQAQLQQAMGRAGEEGEAEDEESAHVDPGRVGREVVGCRVCWSRAASVVVVPCRHLSLCPACDVGADACPVCGGQRKGSVQVFLS